MAQRIDGKAIAAAVKARVAEEVAALKTAGIRPGLAVVLVGDDPASKIYVNNKKKACADLGMLSDRSGSKLRFFLKKVFYFRFFTRG